MAACFLCREACLYTGADWLSSSISRQSARGQLCSWIIGSFWLSANNNNDKTSFNFGFVAVIVVGSGGVVLLPMSLQMW